MDLKNMTKSDLIVEAKRLQERLAYLEPFLASPDNMPFCHHCRDWHRLGDPHVIPVIPPEERV